jgi:hypothetical protein
MTTTTEQHYTSFAEFYPYYLQEHSNSTCRRLHFAGTTLVLMIIAYVIATGTLALLFTLPLVGRPLFLRAQQARHLPLPALVADGRLCHVQRHADWPGGVLSRYALSTTHNPAALFKASTGRSWLLTPITSHH